MPTRYTTAVPAVFDPEQRPYWQNIQANAIGQTEPVCTVNPVAFTSLLSRVELQTSATPMASAVIEPVIQAATKDIIERRPVLHIPAGALQTLVELGFQTKPVLAVVMAPQPITIAVNPKLASAAA